MELFAKSGVYWLAILLLVAGLYVTITNQNLVMKIIGLSMFQASVFVLYLAMGKIFGATAPILDKAYNVYSNPLPHVLILTAIVVGVATTAVGLAMVVRIKQAYGTIEEDDILAMENDQQKPPP